MKIGIQTRLWGVKMNRTNIPELLEQVAAAGYQGIEIGFQHLYQSHPQVFSTLVASLGLKVISVHVAGQYDQPEVQKIALEGIEGAVAFAAAVGTIFLTVSGYEKLYKTNEDIQVVSHQLNQIGELCRQYQLRLCHHNHYWEILDDCRELKLLCEQTDPALVSLCLDVGWIHRVGGDVLKVSNDFSHRIGYMHLRDAVRNDWADFGSGQVDFSALLEFARTIEQEWVIVEQEPPGQDKVHSAFEIASRAEAYLEDLLI